MLWRLVAILHNSWPVMLQANKVTNLVVNDRSREAQCRNRSRRLGCHSKRSKCVDQPKGTHLTLRLISQWKLTCISIPRRKLRDRSKMLKLALISGEQKILLDFQFSLKEPHHFLVKTFRVKFGHNLRMLEMTAVSLSERQSFLEFKTLTQESVSMQAAINHMKPSLH